MPAPDVVIVGGGPAGLAAAIVFGQAEVATLLCERRSFPLDKACGEGLMPSALGELRSLGVPASRLFPLGTPLTGVRYISEKGQKAEACFAEGPGLGLRRTALSTALWERVKQLGAVTILERTEARLVQHQGSDLAVSAGGKEYTPRLVIGADGLHSRMRRDVNLEVRSRGPRRWGIRQHFAVKAWTSLVEVHWTPGIEAYVTPVGPHHVDLAFLWEERNLKRRPGSRIGDFLAHFPLLEERFRAAHACGTAQGAGMFRRRASAQGTDGVLLLGDAAGYLDAITGEGIGLALAQANSLAPLVVPVVQRAIQTRARVTAQELSSFVQSAARTRRYHDQVTELLLLLCRFPCVLERVIGALSAEPTLFQHFLSANQGLIAPFYLPPNVLLSFLRNLTFPPPPTAPPGTRIHPP